MLARSSLIAIAATHMPAARKLIRYRLSGTATAILSAFFALTHAGEAISYDVAAPPFSERHPVPESPVASEHRVEVAGGVLRYRAEIGRIAIRDVETGEARGYIGYIAYRVSPEGSGPRPLTFLWNGGPGANSALLHFEVAGPKRGEGERLLDNAETWLAYTDLVFVDPVGTGFSRPAKAEYADEFYGTVGDVASVTEFVRSWRLLHAAEEAPLYLGGESWGAGRAANVGYALLRQDIPVKGLLLISGGTGLQESPVAPELAAALKVADLAPVALYHGKSGAGTEADAESLRREAERWAREVYAPALARLEKLSDSERRQIVADLSRYSGLPPERIDRDSLSFTPRQYLSGLLEAEDRRLNTFDMRLTDSPEVRFAGAIDSYLRRDLGYRTDLPYVGLSGQSRGYAPGGEYPQGVGARWNYATAEVTPEEMKAAIEAAIRHGGGPPRIGPPLPATAEAVELEPDLRILVAAGRYDSLASCTTNAEIERNLPPRLAGAMRFRCYTGGHMFYRDAPARLAFSRDVGALIAGELHP